MSTLSALTLIRDSLAAQISVVEKAGATPLYDTNLLVAYYCANAAIEGNGGNNNGNTTPLTITTTGINFGVGVVADSDNPLPANGRIVGFILNNESGVPIYVQIHNSASALTSGTSRPVPGVLWRIPVSSTASAGYEFFGTSGKTYGGNMRIAISTSSIFYVPPSLAQMQLISYCIETV